MAATVAGQTAAECMLASHALGFSSGEKSDCYLMPEALEVALKAILLLFHCHWLQWFLQRRYNLFHVYNGLRQTW